MEILGIGPLELLVILVIALIFVGPERLPEIARQIGKTVRTLRSMSSIVMAEWQREFSEAAQMDLNQQNIKQVLTEPLKGAQSDIQRVLNEPMTSIQADIDRALSGPVTRPALPNPTGDAPAPASPAETAAAGAPPPLVSAGVPAAPATDGNLGAGAAMPPDSKNGTEGA